MHSLLCGEATDDMKYTDDAASRKYNLQREEQISEELKEAEEEVRYMRNKKKENHLMAIWQTTKNNHEKGQAQVQESNKPSLKQFREDLAIKRMLAAEKCKEDEIEQRLHGYHIPMSFVFQSHGIQHG